jgi:hypothetical protein
MIFLDDYALLRVKNTLCFLSANSQELNVRQDVTFRDSTLRLIHASA